MSLKSLCILRFEASESSRRPESLVSPTLFGRFARLLTISIAGIAAVLAIGCGSHSQYQSPNTNAATGIRGKVRGGQQPITGSTIQLYAAGTTGDGSAAMPLLNTPVATDSSGDFTITGDYTCPSTPPANVYLVATGGNPGLAAGTNNANISMIAALGPCANLSSSTFVFVNEATTIASVFPFTQFMTSYSALGSGSSDALALDTAFSTTNEFVDTTNGTSPGPAMPAGDGADTTKLYTLSNIVATCINSPGGVAGDSSPCGNFFLYATPPNGSGIAAPTDIVGALLDIANYPTNNLSQLFALAPSNGPFQPTLPVAPADWTIRIEPTITLSLPSTLVGNGNTLTGTVNLSQAAPGGGLTVTVSSSQAGFVTVNSAPSSTVSIAAGATSGTFAYQGVAGGTSVIEADATGYISDTASVTSTSSLISLGTIPTVAPGQSVSLPLSLGTPAPAGGVTVSFATAAGAPAPTSLATVVPASVFISAGLTVPTANPQVTGGTIGSTQITATATGYAPDVATAVVTVTAAFNPNTLSEPLSTPTNLNLTISAPAPAGGITFTLSSGNTAIATVPVSGTATIAAGATSVAIPITGVAAGTTTISASSPGVTTATATVNVGSGITVGSTTIGQYMQGSISVSLATAPTAAITVTISSGSTAVLLSKSSTTPGSSSVTFTGVTTSSVGTVYVQGQSLGVGLSGSSTITVMASSGYSNGTGTVTVNPSGFIINPGQGSITTTTLSPPTSVSLEPAILTPGTLTYAGTGQLNPGLSGIDVPMVIPPTGSGVGTISSPVVFNGGDSSDTASFQPVAPGGTTTISIQSQPANFSTPAQYQSISATVSAPNITVGSVTIGQYMQGAISVSLGATPVVPVNVTVTSGTPGSVLLSKSNTTAGAASVTFTSVTSSSVGTIYVQGQPLGAGLSGSSTVTAVATITSNGNPAGYNNGTGTVTVNPSGFIINPGQGNITTTTFSTPTTVSLEPAILNPTTLTYAGTGQLVPGITPVDVTITSSSLPVGTISTSPVVFNAGDSSDSTTFQPVASGTTTLALGITPPSGFSLPAQYQSITATVTAPNANIGNATIGANMQTPVSISLATAPPSAVTVTVTSNGPTIATISKSSTVVGGTSLTFTNVTSTTVGTIYVQGQTIGTTTVTVAAPGYNNGNGNITVMPSGFIINPGQGNITTTTLSSPTTVSLEPAILNPGVFTYAGTGQLNPGIGPFNVTLGTNPTGVGTITVNPVLFNPSDSSDATAFQPVAAGTTSLSITGFAVAGGGTMPPTPFSTPSQYQSISATVTAPNINVGSTTVGANMQGPITVSLGTAPTVPMDVTIAVTGGTPNAVLLSKSGAVVGASSVKFTSVTSTTVGTVYVQGQLVGSATLTASAVITSSQLGGTYNNGTGTITVDPSGFIINPGQGNITTTTFSPPTTVTLEPAVLNPGVLTYAGAGQLNPGIGPFDVTLTPNPTGIGSITTSPVVFHPSDSTDTTSFQPGPGSGTTTLTIGSPSLAAGGTMPPTAFSTPSQYQSIMATVTAPNINVGSTTVGEFMQGPVSVNLAATPMVPVNVTITSSNGNVLLSTSPSTPGTSSVTFTSVTSTSVGTVYVQGQGSTGTATLTANAYLTSNPTVLAGYNAGTGTITVKPSGFIINPGQGNISATPQSSPTTITLEPAVLNSGVLTYAGMGALDPNVSFTLAITSSNTSVGTLSTNTVVFAGGASSATTIFHPGTMAGTTTIAITDPQSTPFSTPSQYQSITATVTTPSINIGNTTTGASLETAVSVSLGATPLVPISVTVTSNNTSIATVSGSASTFGQTSVTFNNVTSTSVGTIYVQGQTVGATTLSATASGYNTGTGTVTVNPSGFIINPGQGNISTTPTSPATTVTLEPAILNPGILTYAGTAELNPGIGPFNLGLTSSNTAVGTITTSPVVFHGGDSTDSTTFLPAAAGTTNIVVGAQPAGFSTPTQYQQITANVVAALNANIGNTTTGVNLETPVSVELGSAPGSGIAVTVSIANGTGSAVISGSSGVAGTPGVPVTFNNVTTTGVGTVWVQGLTTGTATLTVTAPGYASGVGTVTIDPSGFSITSGNISTTTASPASTIDVQPAILNPGILTVYTYGQLSPGIGSPQIDVVNTGNAAVGSITTSPVTFTGGSTLETTSFMPMSQGTTTINLGAQPVGFSLPSQQQYTQITATVVSPSSNINSVTTGVNMEAPTYIELGAPPQGTVAMNISIANSPTSTGPNVANISSSPTLAGGQTLTLNATTSTVGPIYVQGLTQGTAIITVTPASEYAPSTGTVTVDPSGFIISSGNITTTPSSSATTVTVAPAVLTPGLLTFYSYGQLSPGAGPYPYSLTVTSGDGTVGTISTSPVNLNAGDTSDNTTFVPVGAGSTTVTLGPQPAGFSPPSQPQYTQVNATVVAPDGTSIGNATTGVNMQVPVTVTLGSAPSAPINITVTSLSPGIATVSNSASTVGAASYSFNNVSSAYVGTVYVQGQSAGTATLQVTNTGTFNAGMGTATVNPSGFVINSGNILAPLTSTPQVMVVPAVLNSGVLTLYSYGQLNPGIGPFNIAVTSTNAGIGTISTSPVTFNGGATSATTTFQPVAAGTATLQLGTQPATFSTPSQYQSVTATVTAPGINVGNVVTGVNMENPLVGITLSVAPVSAINVTVTTNGPSIATVSNGSTVVGTNSITFNNVTTTNVGTVWIQGQSLGSTTITVSAPGYTSGIGLATVDPSGFVLQTGDFATTHTSPGTTIPVYAAVLDPSTLDYIGSAQLNPGLSVMVPFTSSNMGAGTISPSPVFFNGGDASENATFTPAGGVGTSTLKLGAPTGAAGFSTPSQTSTQQIIATVD